MTLATTLALVRDTLQDEPWSSTIGGAYTAGGTTLTINDFAGLVQGELLDFADDGTYEVFRISTTPTTSTVTVAGGYDGSTNASHSNGARFYKNPRFSSFRITQAINHIVATRFWPEIWALSTATVVPDGTTVLYDLPADYESFVSLVQTAQGSIEDVVYVDATEELLTVPSGISSSNKVLRIHGFPRTDVNATLFYRAKVTTSNMTSSMEAAIAIGAAAHLLRGEAMQKADRFDEDDRTSRQLRAAREMEREFDSAKQRIRASILQQWGPVRRFRR